MSDNKYDLSNAKVVGVVVKDPEREKEKRAADESFRNMIYEERREAAEMKMYGEAYVRLKKYFMSEEQ